MRDDRSLVPSGLARSALIGVALFAAAWIVGGLVSPFTQGLLARALALGLFAAGYNLVFGLGGMPSLGHATFVGIGSYSLALGVTEYDWSIGVIAVVTIVLSAAAGALLGVLTIRTEGIHLLLLTLAFNIAIWSAAVQQVDFTKGDNGISGLPRSVLPGLTSKNLYNYYLVVVAVLLVVLWVFRRSTIGQVISGISGSPSRMEALGFRVGSHKTIVFAVSAVFCGLAGILLAVRTRSVNPAALEWQVSAGVMVMAIIGGSKTFYGPLLGAILITYAEGEISSYSDRWTTVLGATYVLVIILMPDGILRPRRNVASGGRDE